MIDFGVQSSGDESSKAINQVWNDLLEIFFDDPEMGGYFKKLDDFQIVFRVSGDGSDFESEGPEYLKVVGKSKTITIDFTIPESKWKNNSIAQFRKYIAEGVQGCFKSLRSKAIDMNEVKELEKLNADFKRGMEVFKAN